MVEELGANPELKATFEADAQAALDAGDYGCTLDELDEALLVSREIDENELIAIAGGKDPCPYAASQTHRGACSEDFYVESCAATVELGSMCGSNDKCGRWDVVYTPLVYRAHLV